MTERERLIELIKDYHCYPEKTCQNLKSNDNCANCEYDEMGICDCFAKEADYLLENGVIVPPCKVGDTVYYICFGKIYKGKCHAITRHENSLQIHLYDYDGDNASFASDNVFPTRNEAENALAKKVFDLICED